MLWAAATVDGGSASSRCSHTRKQKSMLNAAIIASVPAAASLANTALEQVREGSQSFAATLSHALQSQTGPPAASSPSSFSEALQDLACGLLPLV